MSAEFFADRLLDLVADNLPTEHVDVDQYAEENVRSGGYWFTCTYRGKHYEVEVTEVTRHESAAVSLPRHPALRPLLLGADIPCHLSDSQPEERNMNREWKPGDIAMASGTGGSFVVVRTAAREGAYWSAPNGWPSGVSAYACEFRPLVVIDPEDREQVERFAKLLSSHGAHRGRVSHNAERWGIRDALREFANPTPPKPEEPQGLGAVVEDEDGEQWVRHRGQIAPWHRADGQPTERPWRYYNDIAVAKVLSEGVQ